MHINGELVKSRLPHVVYRAAQFLEFLVSLLVVAAILISIWSVLLELGVMASDLSNPDSLHSFLSVAFSVVIGIEFLKMLARHNMSSCVEVLLFAIARQMVVEHTDAVENLLMIISIAILFAIRKFLFIPGLDDKKLGVQHDHEDEHEHDHAPSTR